MKTYPAARLLPLVCLALGSIAGAAPLQFPHEHLRFTTATTIYEMVADGGVNVKVKKEAVLPAPGQLARNVVTISADTDGKHSFSLLTLGIQAVTHDTLIVAAPTGPSGALFAPLQPASQGADNSSTPPTWSTQPIDPVAGLLVKATGYTTPNPGESPNRRTVNADNVWFIIFQGKECKLLIEPKPEYVWTTEWSQPSVAPGMGHGTETPH